ncbi:MAG: hypothetical protein H6Q05_4563, partial [Acidobacteria bacterium]|nr:hypothetical protein [Acidobacteriota bacterium]
MHIPVVGVERQSGFAIADAFLQVSLRIQFCEPGHSVRLGDIRIQENCLLRISGSNGKGVILLQSQVYVLKADISETSLEDRVVADD